MILRRFHLFLLLSFASFRAQSQFYGPVATAFRPSTNTYFVINKYGKNVVSIETNGSKDTFITGLYSPNNILYARLPLGEGFIILDSNEIKGYDSSGTFFASFTTPGAIQFQDAVFDETGGALYVSDVNRGVIYQTTFGAAPFYFPTTVIFSSPFRRPSAMVLQKSRNRILYVEDTLGSNLMAMDLTSGATSSLKSLGLDNCVGLAEDGQGNLYISSQGNKALYQLNRYLSGTPKKLVSEPKPADLFVSVQRDQWVYTCIACGTVYIDPLHAFGPGIELEICPEGSFQAYRNIFIKTVGTFEAGNSFIMELSNSSGVFSKPTFLGSVSDTLLPDSIKGVLPPGLVSGTGYRYRWRSTKPAITGGFERMTILQRPTVEVSAFDTVQACTGAKIRLGENNPTGNTGYTWWPASEVDSAANSSVWHVVDSAFKIFVEAIDSLGCKNTDSAWILPVSKPDPGNYDDTISFCKGETAILGNAPNGGFKYFWSPGNLLNDSTLAQPTYSGNNSVEFTLLVEASGGCTNSRKQFVLAKDIPAFTIFSDTVAPCYDEPVLNWVVDSGNHLVLWIGPETTDTTLGDIRLFAWPDSGNVRVIFHDLTSGCSAEKNVFQFKIPLTIATISQAGNVLTLNETLSQVEWFRNDTLYKTDSAQIYVTTSGKYSVCGFNQYQCMVCSEATDVFINANNYLSIAECIVFPNPSKGIIHIDCNNTGPLLEWELYGADGKLLRRGNSSDLDISEYANGIYFLVEKDRSVIRIIKQSE